MGWKSAMLAESQKSGLKLGNVGRKSERWLKIRHGLNVKNIAWKLAMWVENQKYGLKFRKVGWKSAMYRIGRPKDVLKMKNMDWK